MFLCQSTVSTNVIFKKGYGQKKRKGIWHKMEQNVCLFLNLDKSGSDLRQSMEKQICNGFSFVLSKNGYLLPRNWYFISNLSNTQSKEFCQSTPILGRIFLILEYHFQIFNTNYIRTWTTHKAKCCRGILSRNLPTDIKWNRHRKRLWTKVELNFKLRT